MRWQARSVASSSRAPRTSKTSCRDLWEIFATSAPLLGIISTRPSSSSFRIASRIGVRETPSFSASWISIRRSPGFNSPFRIACRSVLKTKSLSGRYSFMLMVKSLLIQTSFVFVFEWNAGKESFTLFMNKNPLPVRGKRVARSPEEERAYCSLIPL